MVLLTAHSSYSVSRKVLLHCPLIITSFHGRNKSNCTVGGTDIIHSTVVIDGNFQRILFSGTVLLLSYSFVIVLVPSPSRSNIVKTFYFFSL